MSHQPLSITAVLRNPRSIAKKVHQGASFTVLSHAKPLFNITPLDTTVDDAQDAEQERQKELQQLIRAVQKLNAGAPAGTPPSPEDIDAHSF
jgi:hypothetical protein